MWCLRLAIALLALPAVSAHEFTLAHLKNALFEKAMALAGLGQTIHYMKGGETSHQHDHQHHKHWHEKMRKKMEEAHKCHSKCGVHAACHSKCPRPWAPFVKACQDFPAIKACYATCKDAECNNCPKFEVAWMNKKLAKHPEQVIKEGEAKCPRLLEAHACHKSCAPGDYDCHQKCPMFHGRRGGGHNHHERDVDSNHPHHHGHQDKNHNDDHHHHNEDRHHHGRHNDDSQDGHHYDHNHQRKGWHHQDRHHEEHKDVKIDHLMDTKDKPAYPRKVYENGAEFPVVNTDDGDNQPSTETAHGSGDGGGGGRALGADDVCYRFCEDSSQPAVSRRTDCPAGTTCRTTMPWGMVSWDTCHSPETCQPEASKGGTEIPVVNTDDANDQPSTETADGSGDVGGGGGALGADDVCYRFCEDSSQPFVSRRTGCPAGTTCRTTMPWGMVSFDTCQSPDTCQPEDGDKDDSSGVEDGDEDEGYGGEHGVEDEGYGGEDGDEEDIERDHQDPVFV